jgi:rhamnosyltransferase
MSVIPHVLLVCPTLNPGAAFDDWVKALKMQKELPGKISIIDSGSADQTAATAVKEGFEVIGIDKRDFNHGGTRQYAIEKNPDYDFVIFLTQDAVLTTSDSITRIIQVFTDPNIAAVCGRQLPRPGARAIEAHARLFNYPSNSFVRTLSDKQHYGVKAAFLSNSFAAYRVSALRQVGGFPNNVIFGEDMYVAAKLLMAGFSLAYEANASVYHSHDYTLLQEARRYFDMGVFHSRESWIRDEFGTAEQEGVKFVVSELKYLLRYAVWRVPEAMLRTFFRYAGFRMGSLEKYIPLKIKGKISMNPGYFKTE